MNGTTRWRSMRRRRKCIKVRAIHAENASLKKQLSAAEEATKRQKTNAIAFDYNQSPTPEPKEGVPTVPEKEEEDEPYKPSPVLDVPVDINIVSKTTAVN